MRPRLVLASGNAGKAREFSQLLGDRWSLVLQAELDIASIPETGTTFAANALLKARHAARSSGLPALADDSGLEVDALNGAPGVYSARYAGPGASDTDNVAKLLAAMTNVPAAQRSARFHCVLALVSDGDDPDPIVVSGVWEGRIARAASGNGGFGYDPVFIDAASGRTAAELQPTEKNRVSHRAQALARLRAALD
ncbi:MAG: RdgB/HAM1 family non-canonical purine NTP pyrophosphatase [Gammaproteobacteria bacterium]|jgi:XTP/dITP diphosphohydrolase|nr:RdgB/HAM1 family non-canonical purine NTP pyrophosphatase [Gammaproteobacteria bacterium]